MGRGQLEKTTCFIDAYVCDTFTPLKQEEMEGKNKTMLRFPDLSTLKTTQDLLLYFITICEKVIPLPKVVLLLVWDYLCIHFALPLPLLRDLPPEWVNQLNLNTIQLEGEALISKMEADFKSPIPVLAFESAWLDAQHFTRLLFFPHDDCHSKTYQLFQYVTLVLRKLNSILNFSEHQHLAEELTRCKTLWIFLREWKGPRTLRFRDSMDEKIAAIISQVIEKNCLLLRTWVERLTSLTRFFDRENVQKIQSIFVILAHIEGNLLYTFISEYVTCSLASKHSHGVSKQQIEKFPPRATVRQLLENYAHQ